MYLKLNETGRPSSEERFNLSASNRVMQRLEALPETRRTETLKLITIGRITGVPHVAELRYTRLDGSFFVLATSAGSDWVLNALAQGKCKANMSEVVYQVTAHTATSLEKTQVLESFRRKYGSRVLDQWYKNTQSCLRLDPLGPPSIRGAVRGENETLVSFREWKSQGNNYYQSVRDAFDSASEEYDYTISHNYINSWIRKRSINELHRITKASDVLLEIGCGTGSEAIQISKQVKGIVATDISEKMLDLLKRRVKSKRLDRKILAARARASEISTVKELLPEGSVRVAYSFNGALNCEPDIHKVPGELSKVVQEDGYFLCSIRNTLCLPEALSHSLVLQFDKTATRKEQPTMVSVGGMDIPSCYYSPSRFANIFRPYFQVRKMIGLPAFLPPAYLSDYYLRTGKARLIPEKLERILGDRFPFNRLGDQTLFVFQKV
jgi:ubiquinone/menaquinone biosynthesis C-methylase UbiE